MISRFIVMITSWMGPYSCWLLFQSLCYGFVLPCCVLTDNGNTADTPASAGNQQQVVTICDEGAEKRREVEETSDGEKIGGTGAQGQNLLEHRGEDQPLEPPRTTQHACMLLPSTPACVLCVNLSSVRDNTKV